MTASWDLRAPVRLVFGPGSLSRIGEIAVGERIVLVTTAGFVKRGGAARVAELLGDRLVGTYDEVQPNPDLDHLDRGGAALRVLNPDGLVALGGGSVMDTAKALAALLAGPATATLDRRLRHNEGASADVALPVIAIPTTSGTGAEVTPFGTVWDHTAAKKYSIAGPALYPHTAVLDPELTLDLPAEVTISTGLDAISQAFESYWNRASNAVSEAWALQAFRLGLESILAIVADPRDLAARTQMMESALLAGLAISHTRTAIAHSISYPITARFGLPHGFACSFTLPAILDFNAEEFPAKARFLANSAGLPDAAALRDKLLSIFASIDLNGWLAKYVPDIDDLMPFVPEMITPGRADNNLRSVDLDDVVALLTTSKALLTGTGADRQPHNG